MISIFVYYVSIYLSIFQSIYVSIYISLINTSKHVMDALYVILWFLLCLGFSFHITNTIRNLSIYQSIYLGREGVEGNHVA